MTIQISVTTPRFWWRMPATQIQQWVPADPDIEDGKQRHSDRDEQDWYAIASIVAEVGNALASGAWITDDELANHGFVTISGCTGNLTPTEQGIITSWFSSSDAVRVDPWFDQLTNGRHRLWATMEHFGEKLVPICGDALGYADAPNIKELGPQWPECFTKNLKELDALDWFDFNDPLNISFRASLVEAAEGSIPSPIDGD